MTVRNAPAASLVFVLTLLALALLAGCRSKPEGEGELRIGLLAPLTNPVRFTGHLAALARVDEINAAGGLEVAGRKVQVRLVVEDSGPTAERAMAAVGRLLERQRVAAVIGPYYSREAIPVGGALESLRVPMLSPSASNPEVTRGRRYTFRACQLDSDKGRMLARYAHEDLGLRRVAVLYDEGDAYSSGLAGYFKTAFEPLPGSALLLLSYVTGQRDFAAQMARVTAFRAQLLFLPNFPPDLSLQLPQARAAGFRGQFLGGDSWDTDRVFHDLPEAQGALFSTEYAQETGGTQGAEAAKALTQRAGAELNKDTALTLDALELLFAAAKRAGGVDSEALRRGLAGLTDFNGLTGSISFTAGGDPERTVCLMEISGGRAVLRERLATGRRREGR